MNMPPCALPTPIICSGYNLALDIKKPYDTDHYIPREHLKILNLSPLTVSSSWLTTNPIQSTPQTVSTIKCPNLTDNSLPSPPGLAA